VFVCIFDSMLRIFITLAQLNRELFICVSVTMILRLMTKICMVFFSVFVCFDGIVAENRRALIYRGSWMLWTTWTLGTMWITQKNPMLNISGLYNPETLKPYVNPDYIIRTRILWVFVSFFDVYDMCWPLYDPRISISCNAIAGFVWAVNNDRDTIDTPKKLKRIEEKRWSEEYWRWKPIYSLKQVLGH